MRGASVPTLAVPGHGARADSGGFTAAPAPAVDLTVDLTAALQRGPARRRSGLRRDLPRRAAPPAALRDAPGRPGRRRGRDRGGVAADQPRPAHVRRRRRPVPRLGRDDRAPPRDGHLPGNAPAARPARPADDDRDEPVGACDTAAVALDALSTDLALTLIAELPREQAQAVLLRAVVGLDARTAGEVLGKRAGAVRVAAHRGLKKLARQLRYHPEEGRWTFV